MTVKPWADMDRKQLLAILTQYRDTVMNLKHRLACRDGVQIAKDIAEAVSYSTHEQIREFKLTTQAEVEKFVMERVRANLRYDQVLYIVNDMEHDLEYEDIVETFTLRNTNYVQEALYDGACQYVYERTMEMLKGILLRDYGIKINYLYNLRKCEFCGEPYNSEDLGTLSHKDGDKFEACVPCAVAHVRECEECGEMFKAEELLGGLCRDCYEQRAVDGHE